MKNDFRLFQPLLLLLFAVNFVQDICSAHVTCFTCVLSKIVTFFGNVRNGYTNDNATYHKPLDILFKLVKSELRKELYYLREQLFC